MRLTPPFFTPQMTQHICDHQTPHSLARSPLQTDALDQIQLSETLVPHQNLTIPNRGMTDLCQARGQRKCHHGVGDDSPPPPSRTSFGPRRCLRAAMAPGVPGRARHAAFAAVAVSETCLVTFARHAVLAALAAFVAAGALEPAGHAELRARMRCLDVRRPLRHAALQ